MKKTSAFLLLALASMLIISACVPVPTPSNDSIMTMVVATLTAAASQAPTETATPQPSETPLPSPSIEPTKEITVIGPDEFPEDVNPLTGEKVDDPARLNRRPILIKVSNFPASGRPHAGLSYADIVFAYAMPGMMSRYIGLYYGKDSNQIGPVRSTRLIDPELVQLYQGVLGTSGGDWYNVLPKVYQMLGNRYVFQGLCPGICDDGHGWVTTVFGDSAAITQFRVANGEAPQKYDLTGTLFDKVAPDWGTDAPKLSFNFSTSDKSDWTYDKATGKYLRWIDNAPNYDEMIPLTDRLTEKQLAFSNVIILEAIYTWYDINLFNTDILGNMPGLKATYLRDGKLYEGTWKVTDPYKPIQFFDNQGNLFPLKPGNTWINITGTNTEYTTENGVPVINFIEPGL
ncbi:MAG TPA: DUF3048 domain-containing protein [Anaerolineaceae bacterium]|nr:DUF3048 domain-containing protein [Anaerolineaceae bacterium]